MLLKSLLSVSWHQLFILWMLFSPLAAAETSPWKIVKVPETVQGRALFRIFFLDEQRGWIVGEQGLCLATTDGGTTWQRRETGTTATLRDIRFNDEKNGWACGEGDPQAPAAKGHVVMGRAMLSGTLLKTHDGGQTWEKTWIPTNFEITCVEASGAPILQVGISGGLSHLDGDITRSPDGGQTWNSERCFRALYDIRAMDQQHWVAVGSPVSVGFYPPPKSPLYARKECRALFSQDGGKTWGPAQGSDGKGCLNGLAVDEKKNVWAVGDEATILRSKDSGRSWEAVPIKVSRRLLAITFLNGNSKLAVAVGNAECVLVSKDSGATWIAIKTPAEGNFYSVAAIAHHFWVVGDKGQVWRAEDRLLEQAEPVELKALLNPVDKDPTPGQLARIRKGESVIRSIEMNSPMGKFTYKQRETVTAISDKKFTMAFEIIEGNAPPQEPKKNTQEFRFSILNDLTEFHDLEVGKTKTEDDEMGKCTATRLLLL